MKPPDTKTADHPGGPAERAEVDLQVIEGDDLDDEERAALYEAIRRSIAEAGQLVDADEFLRELRSRP